MNPEKDISRMSNKRLKFRYGESRGTDKVAEDELRRRGLTDRQIRGVIYGYRQGEYSPRGGRRATPGKNPADQQTPPDEAVAPNAANHAEPKAALDGDQNAATDKKPIMYFGKFKGRPMAEVPGWHLEWCYASFPRGRKPIETELRSRGYGDGDLERCRRRHPVLGKFPKKQPPKD